MSPYDNPCYPQKQSSYNLTIQATDMDGARNGLKGNGTFKVEVLDINDHRPTLEKDEVPLILSVIRSEKCD